MLRTRPFPLVPFGISALLVCGGAVALFARAPAQTAPPAKPAAAPAADLDSCIVTRAAAAAEKGAYGELHTFLTGATRSLKDLLVAEIVLDAGKEIHPAHVHADEEFIYVAKGEGTWNFQGKDVAAHEGDTLYVKPWDLHGITNTGKEKLTFFVVKGNGRQRPVPEKPAAK
ncbi:MAG TPA: cupin domain-containing protein [Planctomycetota bacterium]|nr:cupin domain-containing protein [Planctomycetota bacterium]